MLVIDAQTHVYERNHPGRPWGSELPGPIEVTGDDQLALMDTEGVDGALLVSPYALYGFDPSYALEVSAAHPDRFAVITPVDPSRPDVENLIEKWSTTPHIVGIRLMIPAPGITEGDDYSIEDVGLRRFMNGAARHNVPVCLSCWDRLFLVDQLAATFPECQLVIDHLGLRQPLAPPTPATPFEKLPDLLALARYPNVCIKVSAVATLSKGPFPFLDIRGPLEKVFESFGLERCMWGTDWTRATVFVEYSDAVRAFSDSNWLSLDERTALMGGTLQRVFGWAPRTTGREG